VEGLVIEVAFIDVNAPDAVIETLAELLTAEERARADRYRFAEDRRRSIVARAATRRLVARRLHADPRALRIVEGEHGKPLLADGALHFNASHSGDLVAIAIHTEAVGVDVERRREVSDAIALARRFFSPQELADVVAASDIAAAFFTIWTSKEALVKATGEGIGAADLRAFTIPTFGAWRAAAIAPPLDGYHAAVAARGDDWTPAVRVVAIDALL
jgi:4'-phosphopantetheinyl transferase